jgi:hypothetical protein
MNYGDKPVLVRDIWFSVRAGVPNGHTGVADPHILINQVAGTHAVLRFGPAEGNAGVPHHDWGYVSVNQQPNAGLLLQRAAMPTPCLQLVVFAEDDQEYLSLKSMMADVGYKPLVLPVRGTVTYFEVDKPFDRLTLEVPAVVLLRSEPNTADCLPHLN